MQHRFSRSRAAPVLVLFLIGIVGLRAAAGATTFHTIAPGGPPVTIAIASGDDAAVTFDGLTGQRVSLSLTGVTIGTSSCCSAKVSLLKPDGVTLVAPTNVGTAGGFIDATTLPVDGSYTILVDPQGTASGEATLTLHEVPADVTSAIIPGGPAVTVAPTTPGQNARLTFAGTAGRRVSVKATPVCCSTKVSILKPDGTTLVGPSVVGTSGGLVEPVTLPLSGTYTVVADLQGSAVGSVTLTLYDVPPDVTQTIVPGGPAVTVTTTTPGQNAKLSFTGSAGGRVSLKVGPLCCSTRVSILKPDGTALPGATTFSTSGGFMDVKTLPLAGTYTVLVDPQSWAVGSVTVALYDVPPDVAATIVPGGAPVTVTTTAPGQNAGLTFAGSAGMRISLNISGVTMTSTRVSIADPNGTTLLAPTSVGTGGAFVDTKTLTTTGTHTITIDPQTTTTGSMTLTLYDVPADATATTAPGGAPVTVATTTPGQNARVTFDGSVDQVVTVQFSEVTVGTSTCCSAKVSLLKPDGTALVSAMNVGTSGAFIDPKTLPAAGEYTIELDPQSSATGSVTIAVDDVTGAPPSIVAGGPAVTVTTTVPNDNARLTFDAAAGARVSLALSGVTISNSTVSILSPSGTPITASNVGVNGGFIDATALAVAGRYTILVDPQGSATGSMTLRLYDVPSDAGPSIVPGGAPVTVTMTVPGQNTKVTFTGAADQRVFLKLSNVTIGSSTCCSTKVSMLRPDGSALAAATNVGTSGGFIDTKALPVGGTYTIFVDPQTSSTGAISLTLYDVPADATATATPGGPAVTVTTTTSGQNARVAFEGVGGRQVSLKVGWTPSICCLMKVSIVRPDGGTVLAPLSVGATGAFVDAKMLPVSGTYTINVDPQATATGRATLTLYDVPPDVTAPITPGGPAVTLTTTADGQNARFTFTAAAGDGALVTVGPNCCATNVSILKPDLVPVAAAVAFTAGGGTMSARLPVAGVYTIFVDLQGQSVGSVTARLLLDGGPPAPPVLTITEASPNSHASGAAFYYRPGGTGPSFTVNAATTDSGSGVQRVAFPGLGGGFTPTITTSDFTSPYSQLYTWASTATFSRAANTVTVYDNVGNTSTATFAVLPDSGAPTTTDDTASIGSAWRNTTQTVTLTPFDAISGVGATHYTTNGSTPTTGSPQGTVVTLGADGVHTIKYFSLDNVGNAEAVRTAGTAIRIDKTSPSSTITFPASGRSYNAAGWNAGCATAGLCGTASDALSGVQNVELSIRKAGGNYWDGSAFASASEVFLPASGTAAWSYSFAAAAFAGDGSYTIRVRAVDIATNVEIPVTRTFTYDTAPPDTSITAAPPALSNSAAASFSFTANEAGSTFQCSLDGGAFAACTSPKAYTGLTAGAHTFQVRATDVAGNVDATPASHSWTVDLTAPNTTIDSGPTTPTNVTTATFSFSASEAGTTFQCSLDGGAFAACTSPKTYTAVAGGAHTFRARAVDAAGNIDATPATYSWTVDLTAPATTIVLGPSNPTNSTNGTFTFSSSESGSTFECSLDGAAFAACTSPRGYSGLTAGNHSFQVRATDLAGNVDLTPATHDWTIDLVAPETTITAGPSSPSNSANASFSFSASEGGGSFQCSLDGGAFTGCTSPKTYTGLAAGPHTFRVRAIDAAGNLDASPATHGWTIDLAAPETTIDTAPASLTSSTSATFTFSSSESGSTFECSLDAGAFGACTSPHSYGALAEGPHTFRVRASDTAGNTDASPASRDWTVDLTPPETTITAQPASVSNSATSSFSFSASEAGSTFECSLDGGAFTVCTTPNVNSGLAEGVHTFQVRAIDPVGNTDSSPASYDWTVDLTAPAAPVITDPPADTTTGATVTLGGTAEPGSSVIVSDGGTSSGTTGADATGAWAITLTGVADGVHTYTARATDVAGNVSSPSGTRSVTVDTTAPETTIATGPALASSSSTAMFTFSSSEPSSGFECALDGGAFVVCTSPASYSGLAEGPHGFEVRATDSAGNADLTAASYGWTIDLTVPAPPAITNPPVDTTSGAAITLAGTAEPGSGVEIFDDGNSVGSAATDAAGTWTVSLTGVADGVHPYTARATDIAGNTSSPSETRTITVDTSPPETTIASGPEDPTNQTSASFSFGSSQAGSSFECSLDGAGFAACSSPESYVGLAEGAHTFRVQATDPAGNTDATPATSSWSVDLTSPETSISASPADPTNQTSASFSFASSEPGSTFQCSLDAAPFTACVSPEMYPGLSEGAHTFRVSATDAAENFDATPATYGWVVDLTAPESTIDSGPEDPTAEPSATFSFSASETGAAFECSLDGAPFEACTSPQGYTGLTSGQHVFEVRATDQVGNAETSAAVYPWTVL